MYSLIKKYQVNTYAITSQETANISKVFMCPTPITIPSLIIQRLLICPLLTFL